MRVAITGMDALTPIGNGLGELARGLAAGRGGAGPITAFDASRHRVRRAAQVDWHKPQGSRLSRATEMALRVAQGALADAGLDAAALHERRVGLILASNQGGMPPSAQRYRELTPPYRTSGSAGAARLRILDGAPSATLDRLAAELGAQGPSLNLSTACSAGLHALGLAFDWLRSGGAELVMVVAAEVLTELALAGFGVLRALTEDEEPRPFDVRRDGTMLGEGAAALVIEDAEQAQARGCAPWAEISGYGSSTDAYHATRPQAEGPARAMREALQGCAVEGVDWIKAHGTGTPANDEAEAAAIVSVFGAAAGRIPVTSLKASVGHSLGASGVVETVMTVLALAGGYVPPTRGARGADPACPLDVVSGQARPLRAQTVLANAFGFGGNNASVLFRRRPGQWRKTA